MTAPDGSIHNKQNGNQTAKSVLWTQIMIFTLPQGVLLMEVVFFFRMGPKQMGCIEFPRKAVPMARTSILKKVIENEFHRAVS